MLHVVHIYYYYYYYYYYSGLPWRYKEYNFDDEDDSSDDETKSRNVKRWEMRYQRMSKTGRPPWSCDMGLFPPSTSYEVRSKNVFLCHNNYAPLLPIYRKHCLLLRNRRNAETISSAIRSTPKPYKCTGRVT